MTALPEFPAPTRQLFLTSIPENLNLLVLEDTADMWCTDIHAATHPYTKR